MNDPTVTNEIPATLCDAIASAESENEARVSDEWSELARILERAGAAQPRDGRRALEIAARLDLPARHLRAMATAAVLAAKQRAEADSVRAELARLRSEVHEQQEKRGLAAAAIGRMQAEKARIENDLPGELATMRQAVEALVALAAADSATQGSYLKSRGWGSRYVPASVAGLGRVVYSKPDTGGAEMGALFAIQFEARQVLGDVSLKPFLDKWRLSDAAVPNLTIETPAPADESPATEQREPAAAELAPA